MAKSLVDIAFEFVSSKGRECGFEEIWQHVCEVSGIDPTNISKKSQFYSTLFIDGRLYNLGDNQWNLASYQTFEDRRERLKRDDEIDDSDIDEIDPEDSEEYEKEPVSEDAEEAGEAEESEEEFN